MRFALARTIGKEPRAAKAPAHWASPRRSNRALACYNSKLPCRRERASPTGGRRCARPGAKPRSPMHAELACIGVVTRHGRTKLRTRAPQPTRGRYNRRLDMADSIAKWAMQVRAGDTRAI